MKEIIALITLIMLGVGTLITAIGFGSYFINPDNVIDMRISYFTSILSLAVAWVYIASKGD